MLTVSEKNKSRWPKLRSRVKFSSCGEIVSGTKSSAIIAVSLGRASIGLSFVSNTAAVSWLRNELLTAVAKVNISLIRSMSILDISTTTIEESSVWTLPSVSL